MKKAVYIGNFDPVTLGHMDIIQRAVGIVEERLILGVSGKPGKSFLLPLEQRRELLEAAVAGIPRIEIQTCTDSPVSFAAGNQAQAIIRGVRNITDFEYELHMSQMNRKIASEIEMILLFTNQNYSFLSSGVVRECMSHGMDVSQFVPRPAAEKLKRLFSIGI